MRPIMMKFNNVREEAFQIETTIYKMGNTKVVSKTALTEPAKEHIRNIYKAAKLLQQVYPECLVSRAEWRRDRLYFEFLQGALLSARYEKALVQNNKEEFINTLIEQKKIILSCRKENIIDFYETEYFLRIFGDGKKFLNHRALEISDFEMTSQNIIVDANGSGFAGIIDYEYVFQFPIPVDLLLYHCVIKTNVFTIPEFQKLLNVPEMLEVLQLQFSEKELEESWIHFSQYYVGDRVTKRMQYLKRLENIAELREKFISDEMQLKGNAQYIQILTNNLGKQQEFINSQEAIIKMQKDTILQKQNEIGSLWNDINNQQEFINSQEAIIKMQKDTILQKQNEIGSLWNDINNQQKYIELQTRKIEDMDLAIEQEKQKNEELKASLSWKITGPLRKVHELIPKCH